MGFRLLLSLVAVFFVILDSLIIYGKSERCSHLERLAIEQNKAFLFAIFFFFDIPCFFCAKEILPELS